ncbi:MAG: helix-turn-helix domain-containing protein, partial [Holdemania filiformis]
MKQSGNTMGMVITSLRKAQGMTQAELAEKMQVTDKAVSKWERDLSCPDIQSLPRLAEILEVSVEELM